MFENKLKTKNRYNHFYIKKYDFYKFILASKRNFSRLFGNKNEWVFQIGRTFYNKKLL